MGNKLVGHRIDNNVRADHKNEMNIKIGTTKKNYSIVLIAHFLEYALCSPTHQHTNKLNPLACAFQLNKFCNKLHTIFFLIYTSPQAYRRHVYIKNLITRTC